MSSTLLLALAIWMAPPQAGSAPRDVKRLYDRVAYQRDLPLPHPSGTSGKEASGGGTADHAGGDLPPYPPGRHWARDGWRETVHRPAPRGGRAGRLGRRTPRLHPQEEGAWGGPSGSLVLLVVWVALAAVVLVALAALLRNRGAREKARAPGEAGVAEEPRARLDAPRARAEALAGAGRYAEAVHALLLETIAALAATRSGRLPEAWTSREIQREAPMPGSARACFGDLVDAVELSLFGGRDVDPEAWEACLGRFGAFERAYRAGRA